MAWETLASRNWPSWVTKAANNNALHAAWDDDRLLILYGRTFEYRVTPVVIDQGHWAIGGIERQLRPRRKKK